MRWFGWFGWFRRKPAQQRRIDDTCPDCRSKGFYGVGRYPATTPTCPLCGKVDHERPFLKRTIECRRYDCGIM